MKCNKIRLPLSCSLRNDYNGRFYVMCISLQLKTAKTFLKTILSPVTVRFPSYFFFFFFFFLKQNKTKQTLEKEMAIHSSILAWRIPWTEKPGGLQSMGSQESDTT